VFRGCMLPLLSSARFTDSALVLGCPLFFGAAHLHHAWELHTVRHVPLHAALLSASFQCAYTTLFGALATLLLLRTGTLAAPLAAHVFCNWMGLPDFARILGGGLASRLLLLAGILAFAAGTAVLWRTPTWP
jgi:prenyl protein peptidase